MISIRPIQPDTAALLDQIDNRYTARETVSAQYDDAGFTLAYAPLPKPVQRTYPPGGVFTAQELLRRKDAECFFAWADDKPVGQAVVATHWTKLAMLYDIRVDESARGAGVGRALIDACVRWAKEQGLKGLIAETQAQNPSACRFYQHIGFVLGGVDRLLYAAIPRPPASAREPLDYALFFYLLFS